MLTRPTRPNCVPRSTTHGVFRVLPVHARAGSDHYGNFLYLEAAHRYLKAFLLPVDGIARTLHDVVTDAAFCILFFSMWHKHVADPKNKHASLERNFISTQTYLDILISCQMLICIIALFRDRHPGVLFQPAR